MIVHLGPNVWPLLLRLHRWVKRRRRAPFADAMETIGRAQAANAEWQALVDREILLWDALFPREGMRIARPGQCTDITGDLKAWDLVGSSIRLTETRVGPPR